MTNPSVSAAIRARASTPNLKVPTLNIAAARLRFLFRQAYAADLPIAIGPPGDLVVIDGTVVFSGDTFGQRDPFSRGEVRELGMPRLLERNDVAYSRNAGDVRMEITISTGRSHAPASMPASSAPSPFVTGPVAGGNEQVVG